MFCDEGGLSVVGGGSGTVPFPANIGSPTKYIPAMRAITTIPAIITPADMGFFLGRGDGCGEVVP